MNRKLFILLCGSAAALLFLSSKTIFSQPDQTNCKPGINYWSLLKDIGIGYSDGRLSINKLYALCLPMPEKPGSGYHQYDPDGNNKLTSVVKRADGTVLTTYVWYARNFNGLWEMERYKVLGGYETIKPLTAGNYTLEFAIDGKPFYRFPFSVSSVKNDDPYQPAGERYFIEGAWNDYGNVFYQRNDPASSFGFTMWLQEKVGHENKTSVPYTAKLVREKDGKVLGEDSSALRMPVKWADLRILFHPGNDKNSFLKAGEVLQEDGTYSVRVTIDGKSYGKYPFIVKEGRIQIQGRQVREDKEAMNQIVDYIYGKSDGSRWIKRENER
jgi:hypothetical protein